MDGLVEQLASERFWTLLALILPMLSGILTRLLRAVERGEVAASMNQRWVLERVLGCIGYLLRFVNDGPASWRSFVLAALAAATVALSGCGLLGDGPATAAALQEPVEAFCAAEAERIDREVLDPEANAHAQDEAALWCDVVLSLIDSRAGAETFLEGDDLP